MNKAELVAALEARLGSRKAAAEALEAVVDTIQRAVVRGEKVAISGFGSFERAVRNARTGRNPRTGEKVRIKKTSVPRFKAGTSFKAYVADPRSLPKATVAPAAKAPAKAPARTTVRTAAGRTTARTPAKAPARTAAKAPARTAAKSTTAKAPARRAPAKTATKTAAKAPARTAAKRTTRS